MSIEPGASPGVARSMPWKASALARLTGYSSETMTAVYFANKRQTFGPSNLLDCLAHYLLAVNSRKVTLLLKALVSFVDDNKAYITGLQRGLNEVIPAKHLV